MIKAKFRDHVRSRTPVAMVNASSSVTTFACWSKSSHELGVDVKFNEK